MTHWLRVSRAMRCPVCDRPDWCLVAADGTAAICPRTSEGAVKHLPEAGYLHRLTAAPHAPPVRHQRPPLPKPAPQHDFAVLSAKYEAAADDARVARFAAHLAVSTQSLRALRIGWDGEGFHFPMRDGAGAIIGIRRRLPGGRKLCVPGSRTGLFVPDGLPADRTLFVAEGESDTAALLTLGLSAIGRPGCLGCTAYLLSFVDGHDVVILGDQDPNGAGQSGAAALAFELRAACRSVNVIIPPPGIKDARAWLRAGATRHEIERTLRYGRLVTPPVGRPANAGLPA